jgi:ketosteroid isomerase-like protein
MTNRAYAALNAREFDLLVDLFGADSVWDVSRWGLGRHAGPAAIRHFLEDWFDSFVRYELRIEEMSELENGVVVAVSVFHAWPAGGRESVRLRSAAVFVWERETLAEVTLHPDIEQGRAAGGRLASAARR